MDAVLRKRSEEAMKRSEERYRATFEHTGTAMIVIEEDTTISMANKKLEEIWGYNKEEIEGNKSWMEFVHPDDLERMLSYHYARREGENPPKKYGFRLIDREGKVRNIFITIDVIPGTNKSIASLLDVTQLRRLNKLLKAITGINEVVAREKNPDVVLEAVCENLGSLYDGVFTALGNDIENLEPVKSKEVNLKSIEKSIRNCPSIKEAIKGNIRKIRAGGEICEDCLSKPRKYVLSIPLSHEKCHGVITIHSDFDFNEEEITLLEKLTSNIAFALNAYDVEKDKIAAVRQLAANLYQFDKSADRLRNPLAVIMSSLELVDTYGKDKTLKIVNKHAKRLEEELDELRKEETNTYNLVDPQLIKKSRE